MTQEQLLGAGKKLREFLKELRENHKHESPLESWHFVLWFMLANFFPSRDEDGAKKAIIDGARDMGADAVLVNHEFQKVIVVQAKHHQPPLLGKLESPRHLQKFDDLRQRLLLASQSEIGEFLQNANAQAAEKLRTAWRMVHQRGYALNMHFVTCGRVNPAEKRSFERDKNAPGKIWDGRDIGRLVLQYEQDAAPSVPKLRLQIAGKHLHHTDARGGMGTWIFPMRGDHVGNLYSKTGIRIFAANIRGYLDKRTPVNRDMEDTLKKNAEEFFYLNNGVTIACEGVDNREIHRNILTVRHPQIINGQQTTRTLADDRFADHSRNALVLIRVFESPGEQLTDMVVRGVNHQNPIKEADLRANDARQINLERKLQRMGIGYGRKRESKQELKKRLLQKVPVAVKIYTKEDFARAVGGCNLDPDVVRSGLDNLFREKYDDIFPPDADPHYYLSRHCVMEAVKSRSRGYPSRGYAIWMVLRFVWNNFSPAISRRKRVFCRLWMGKQKPEDQLARPLRRAAELAFVEALKFYRKESGKAAKKKDVSIFFKNTRDLSDKFNKFWRTRTPANKRREFDECLRKIKQALNDLG